MRATNSITMMRGIVAIIWAATGAHRLLGYVFSTLWLSALCLSAPPARGDSFSFDALERSLATFDPGGRYVTRPLEHRFPDLNIQGSYYFWSDRLLSDKETVGFRERDYDWLQAQSLLELALSYRVSSHVEITSVNHLMYDAVYDIEDANGLYADRVDRSFEQYDDFDHIARELYVSYRRPKFDLVLGKQQIAWGKMDGQFIDVINSMDFRESVQLESSDYELRRIPLWMANVTYYFQGTSLNLLWIPDFEKNVLPAYGSPWSSPLRPPQDLDARTNGALLNAHTNAVGDRILNSEEPDWYRFRDHQFAARLDSANGALTWGLIYYYAWARDASQSVVGRFSDGGGYHLILQPHYKRLHHFGVTADYSWEMQSVPFIGSLPIVMRAEALYTKGVAFADFDKLAAARSGGLTNGISERDTLRGALAFDFAFPASVSVIIQPSVYYTFDWHPGLGSGFGGASGDRWNFVPVVYVGRPIRATGDRLQLGLTVTPIYSGPNRGFQGIKNKFVTSYELSQYIQARLVYTNYGGGDPDDRYGQYDRWDNIGVELQYEF